MITAEALLARTQDAYRRGVEDGCKAERERCRKVVSTIMGRDWCDLEYTALDEALRLIGGDPE